MKKSKNGWAVAFDVILTIYLIVCIVAGAIWIYIKYFKPKSFTEKYIGYYQLTGGCEGFKLG